MPSSPPSTKFYHATDVAILWRDVSRLYENFCGEVEEQWPEKTERFVTVLEDTLVKLRESQVRQEK